jgi:hypothetical protein
VRYLAEKIRAIVEQGFIEGYCIRQSDLITKSIVTDGLVISIRHNIVLTR